nr:hypothetical protein [uncultured Kingella sp.]
MFWQGVGGNCFSGCLWSGDRQPENGIVGQNIGQTTFRLPQLDRQPENHIPL